MSAGVKREAGRGPWARPRRPSWGRSRAGPGRFAAAPRSVGSAGVPTVPCAVSPGSCWSARARVQLRTRMIGRPLRRSCSESASCRGPPRVAASGTVAVAVAVARYVRSLGRGSESGSRASVCGRRRSRLLASNGPSVARLKRCAGSSSAAVMVTVTAVLARARGGLGPRDASEFELLQT